MYKLHFVLYFTGMVSATAGLFVPWEAVITSIVDKFNHSLAVEVNNAMDNSLLHTVWFETPLGAFDLDMFMKLCCFLMTMACGYKTLKSDK